jgi:hypothetical protein
MGLLFFRAGLLMFPAGLLVLNPLCWKWSDLLYSTDKTRFVCYNCLEGAAYPIRLFMCQPIGLFSCVVAVFKIFIIYHD